jgi:transcriptional regulator with XRE-family HTH domain
MSLQSKFAANLKAARARRQMSQEALAAKAGLSTSFISMLENARRSPPLDTLEALSAALHVKPSSLLGA